MIPSRSLPFAAKALALLATLASLLVVLWCACCDSPRASSPSWADHVRARPWMRDLDPAVAHPGWPGRPSACGAGKCG